MTKDVLPLLTAVNLAGLSAVVVVLVLRRPARALLGARTAYALWLIVPAAMAAMLVPARTIVLATPAPMVERPVATQSPHPLPPPTSAPPVKAVEVPPPRPALDLEVAFLGLWLAGAAVSLGLLAVGQRRAIARFGRITPDRRDGRIARASGDAVGPALLGVVRPRIVLPADFEHRFEIDERALILAHERAHLKSGHAQTNGLVALFVAINWFNPLLHLAARLARIDQELACDALVVARHPDQRQAYARALVKTQVAATPLPLGCYWPGRSRGLLMERVETLDRKSPGRFRLWAGGAAVAALTCGAGLTAWAAQPPTMIAVPASARSQVQSHAPTASPASTTARQTTTALTAPEVASAIADADAPPPTYGGDIQILPKLTQQDIEWRRARYAAGHAQVRADDLAMTPEWLTMMSYALRAPALSLTVPKSYENGAVHLQVAVIAPDGAVESHFTREKCSAGCVDGDLIRGAQPFGNYTAVKVTDAGQVQVSGVFMLEDTPILVRDVEVASGEAVTIQLPSGRKIVLIPTVRPATAQEKALVADGRTATPVEFARLENGRAANRAEVEALAAGVPGRVAVLSPAPAETN